jgi:hypothetical protein
VAVVIVGRRLIPFSGSMSALFVLERYKSPRQPDGGKPSEAKCRGRDS